MGDGNLIKPYKMSTTFVLTVIFQVNPKRTWREVVEKDCQPRKLNKEDTMDRSRWRKLIKDF